MHHIQTRIRTSVAPEKFLKRPVRIGGVRVGSITEAWRDPKDAAFVIVKAQVTKETLSFMAMGEAPVIQGVSVSRVGR